MSRKERVEQALRDTLAGLIAREVKDPRVTGAGLVSITKVECNVDLAVAHVYVSVYGGPDGAADRAVAGLNKAAGFLRGPTGRALNLAHPPELRFVHDVSPEMGEKLAEIMRDDEARARAAGRSPGQPPAETDDTTSDREPTQVLDDEPTADLKPAPAIPGEDDL